MKKTKQVIRIVAMLTALCALALPLLIAAEETPVIELGVLQLMDHPSLSIIEEAIREGLAEEGIEARVNLRYKNAQGDFANITTLANQLVAEGCELLVPITTPCAQAALAAVLADPQSTTSIIFAAVTDPVAAGLDDPRVAGVSDEVDVAAILALAEQLTPGFRTVGLLYNAGEANSVASVEQARAICAEKGLKVVEATVGSTAEVAMAAQSLAGKADICFTSNDNTVAEAMPVYAQMGLDNKIPIYVGADTMVADGGLATVGIDYRVLGRMVAKAIHDYLDGMSMADIGIRNVPGAQGMVNVDTAAVLGLTVPEGLREIKTGEAL